jgi:hypothetical protein
VDIFHRYVELGNADHTEWQLIFQDSRNPSVFVTTPTVGGTALWLTDTNRAIIPQKILVITEQQQAFV